jgi:hypothetical protein
LTWSPRPGSRHQHRRENGKAHPPSGDERWLHKKNFSEVAPADDSTKAIPSPHQALAPTPVASPAKGSPRYTWGTRVHQAKAKAKKKRPKRGAEKEMVGIGSQPGSRKRDQ